MRCASCGFENPDEMKFCEECGTTLRQVCPSCGQPVRPTAKFCGACGTTLEAAGKPPPAKTRKRQSTPSAKKAKRPAASPTAAQSRPAAPEAERRQLTVMFCDLVGSTALSERLDPEELREVVRAYQEMSATVITSFEGHIAQYLGDGLLVYFGYPRAHEDDAQRAVRAGLEIVEALHQTPFLQQQDVPVRIGIHTGPVVVGEIGGGGQRDTLALGETPNIAARLQGLAEPDTVIISTTTQRLIAGFFDCQDLGPQTLKGVSAPLRIYRVLNESSTQSRLEVDISTGKLTPLVGRANEVGLVLERWAAAQAGDGQVVLLSGDPGIGKSRLVQEVKERVVSQGATSLEFRCSPYFQTSAFYPALTHLHRLLHFQPDDTPQAKLDKLQQTLARYRFPQADTLPLLAGLLLLPQLEGTPLLTFSPQKQKQRTQEALVAWLVEEAERAPIYCIWEDLHWADPSTLELLGLLLAQVPTTRLFVMLTCRPEFTPSWSSRTRLTPLALARLPRTQAATMIEQVTRGKTLPPEVFQHIVHKTDGVPLFVEELTKMVVESGLLRETDGHYELTGPLPPLAIPTTLQDSLMARLDKLATVREVAQVGATLGREFSYELLHAVSPSDEVTLQKGLARLVEAELLYQRGLPPHSTYIFKHALICDTAYQSLLKSTRQQIHQQIAQVFEARFPVVVEAQPELVAQHYTAAGCAEQAVVYWQRAGQHARDRSAHLEAISHLTSGIELLKSLPETPARTQHALTLHIALGAALLMTRGHAAPEVEHAYTRARELCQQMGETPQLIPVLFGLWRFYIGRRQLHTARELGETLLRLVQQAHDPAFAVIAHYALGATWLFLGALPAARQHLEEGIALYTPDQRPALVFRTGQDPGVACRAYAAWTLWLLGYPEQALAHLRDALVLARELSHPYSLAFARAVAGMVSQWRRDVPAVHEHAEDAVTLSTEQGFPQWAAMGTLVRGWALAMQDQGEEGMTQVRQGTAAFRATGAMILVPYFCTVLAEVCDHLGHTADGLQALAEAPTLIEQHDERWWEAEIYRLRGVLLLRQTGTPQAEAETWLRRALDVARHQEAKWLELRAAMSLSRLWQQQGKREEARQLLAEIYGWFTEGFDTKDLQEAKALLKQLT
ncbi:MAG: AAA family ATPase [Deltaproteobacteria bacterium]|nr:AAA family ATPase [Deltaproteobacteria bacterium]